MLMFLPFATDLYLINIAYVLTAAAVSLELYWGLSIVISKFALVFLYKLYIFCLREIENNLLLG